MSYAKELSMSDNLHMRASEISRLQVLCKLFSTRPPFVTNLQTSTLAYENSASYAPTSPVRSASARQLLSPGCGTNPSRQLPRRSVLFHLHRRNSRMRPQPDSVPSRRSPNRKTAAVYWLSRRISISPKQSSAGRADIQKNGLVFLSLEAGARSEQCAPRFFWRAA